MRRLAPLSVIALSTVASAQLTGRQVASWFDRDVKQRIHITGSRQFAFHLHTVEGDREAFNSLTYYGQGGKKFTDTGTLSFNGSKVLGLFDFDAVITDNRYQDPQAQRFALNLNRGPFQVSAGDIQASLINTNPYASIYRIAKGASVGFTKNGLTLKALRTETKSSARTIAFQGTNSAGPYYLQSNQLVPGSEQILLDGQPMTIQVDYVIDYQVGAITFVNHIIAPTSTITTTYEALDYNSAGGTITGVGASYNMGKFGRVGLTAVEQTNKGNGGLSSRLEQFEGFGAASTPYFLQFEPLSTPAFPTLVRVDGIIQVANIDYYFDPTNKSIFYFRRFIPASSLVEVSYYPKPTSIAEGDRRVIGLDISVPLNSRGSISYAQATGSLKSDVTPLAGTAKGIRLSYESGGLRIKGGLQDIPEDFVSIETRGFNRNERSSNLDLTYNKRGLVYGLSHKNSSVSTRGVDALGQVSFSRAREVVSRLSVSKPSSNAGQLSWNLDHTKVGIQRLGTETDLNTTSIFASQSHGRLTGRYGVQNQFGSVVASKSNKHLDLQSLRFDADYTAGKNWIVNARTGVSRSRYEGESGTGHDLSLNAVYRPSEALTLDLGITESKAGQVSTLAGFTGNLGVGYGGNGFSSGLLGSSPIAGGADLQLFQAHVGWKASDRLSFDGRVYKAKTSGSVSSNTDTTAIGLGFDYDFGRNNMLSLSLDRSETKYLDSPIKSSATTLDASLGGRLSNRWSYRFGTSFLITGGSSEFSQNSTFFDGSFTYRINPRQNASFRFSTGKTTGYYPQEDMYAALFYEYQLYKNISLVGSYKWRRVTNLDSAFSSGAYKSRGFDLEISFNFGG